MQARRPVMENGSTCPFLVRQSTWISPPPSTNTFAMACAARPLCSGTTKSRMFSAATSAPEYPLRNSKLRFQRTTRPSWPTMKNKPGSALITDSKNSSPRKSPRAAEPAFAAFGLFSAPPPTSCAPICSIRAGPKPQVVNSLRNQIPIPGDSARCECRVCTNHYRAERGKPDDPPHKTRETSLKVKENDGAPANSPAPANISFQRAVGL